MRNLRWKRFWIQICTEGILCNWLSELILMNLSDINFLTLLNVIRLWSTSTIVIWINQARFTDTNNLLVRRIQSFYHELFLINNHIHSNIMTPYVISACHSAGKLYVCIYDFKTHQHVFWISTRFFKPQQGFLNLNKIFETLTRFSKILMRLMLLWWGNTSGLLRTEWILEGGWCHNVIMWHVHRPLIRVR